MNKEEIDNLLLLLFNDNLTDCGKRKLKYYIENLQNKLIQSKKFIKMIKDESYQCEVTGICDVALGELGDIDE